MGAHMAGMGRRKEEILGLTGWCKSRAARGGCKSLATRGRPVSPSQPCKVQNLIRDLIITEQQIIYLPLVNYMTNPVYYYPTAGMMKSSSVETGEFYLDFMTIFVRENCPFDEMI